MHETYDSSENSATALYLDESTGNLVVQKYHLSDSGLKSSEFKFPQRVQSFGSFYHPISKLRPEIKEEKKVIEMGKSSPKVQVELENTMGLSRESGNELMRKVVLEIDQSLDNKVISSGTSGPRTGFAIVTDLSGKLVFAKGMKKKSASLNRAVFPQDLVDTLASKKTKTIDISTPGNIEKALNSLNSTMDAYDFSHKQKEALIAEVNRKRKELDQRVSKMSLVKSTVVKGETRELFFNFDDGSFYLRVSKNNKIIDDEIYPLTDDKNLDDLKSKLKRLGLYNKNEFEETFSDFYVGSCESLEDISSLLPDLDSNIANILKVNDKVWGSYLENAVSKKPIVLEDGSMIVSISALNQSHNVKVMIGDDGRVGELKFLDEAKALRDGLEIRRIVENGEGYFKIVVIDSDSKSETDQFFFDIENDATGEKNIAIYVRGNGENKEIYDKNTYKISLSENKIITARPRVHLSSERTDSYPTKISKRSGQGIKTFLFNSFFSLEGRRDHLADEIRDAVNSQIGSINKDGKEYLNKAEVNSIVLDIVRDVETDIPKLDANISKLTAKTYEHSYKNFVSNIVPKMIREIVPGESDEFYAEITKISMKGLDSCLAKASSKSNEKAAEECLNTYTKEAPVIIGMEVMKFQLMQNDQGSLVKTSSSEYSKCIKENYDITEDMSYIKGCIFKAMFTAVDKGLESVVNISLKKMESDYRAEGKDIKLVVKRSVLTQARKDLRSCYQEKGYINPTKFKDNYNQKKLNSRETDDFKNDLLSCSSKIEQVVGRSVSASLISFELGAMDIKGPDRDEIREQTISKGYDNCIRIQNGIADRALKDNEFYKVEATKCTNLVTMTASELVITKTLKQKLGKELWDKLEKSDQAPHIMCFEDLKSKGRDELFVSSVNESFFEKESARCLKDSVEWASYYLGEKELSSIFESDPLYRNVKLSDAKKSFFAKKIQSCFKEKLKNYNTVSSVSGSLDKIQSQCTVSLVMSEEASEDILTPVVTGLLEDSDVDPSIIDKAKGTIVKKMRENVFSILSKKELSLDEVVAEFKNIKGEATYIVADQTINKYVQDMVPGESSDSISKDLRQKLFEGEYNFKTKLLNAQSEDELGVVIDQMTEVAAIELTGHASRAEGQKLLDKELLKSKKDVEDMASSASSIMEQCLEKRKSDQELKSYLDTCILKVKSSVTYNVFADQLSGILNEGDYASAFTKKEREDIYNKFINEDFRNDIDEAYKKDNLSELQSSFTLSATSVIGEKVLKQSIADIYTKNSIESSAVYQKKLEDSLVVSTEANNVLQECLSSIDGKEGTSSDQCINSARMKATTLVFQDKIGPVLELLSNNKETQNEFSNKVISGLEKCVSSNSNSTGEYTDTVNSCLIESIFGLVPSITKNAGSTVKLFYDLEEDDQANYNRCIQEEKKSLLSSNKELSSNKLLSRLSNTSSPRGDKFWIEFFKASTNEDSQKRVDWAIEVVEKCALSNIVPDVIKTIANSSELKKQLSLSSEELEFSKDILSKLEAFSKDTFKNGLWLDLPAQKDDSKDVELKMITTYLDDYLPMVGDYLRKLHSYDSKEAKIKFDKFLNTLREKLKVNGTLSLDDLKAELMESELIDLIIESEISSFIKKEAKEPLSKEGVDQETIEKLGSKEIIGTIFKSEEGRKSISEIKESFIKPMLNGSGGKDIPANIVTDVKHLLAKDTRLGGFVETLTGAIVQKNLEDKKPQNFATNGIASILGFDDKDFHWSNIRKRQIPGIPDSDQPVTKAIEYFGDKILLPILLNEDLGTRVKPGVFNSSVVNVIDDRKEEFSGMVEELMKL